MTRDCRIYVFVLQVNIKIFEVWPMSVYVAFPPPFYKRKYSLQKQPFDFFVCVNLELQSLLWRQVCCFCTDRWQGGLEVCAYNGGGKARKNIATEQCSVNNLRLIIYEIDHLNIFPIVSNLISYNIPTNPNKQTKQKPTI